MKPPLVDMSVSIGKLRLKNPVLTASGTFGYGLEFLDFFDVGRLGGVVTKGLSLEPRRGNPSPRVFETPSGMINAIGLENVGLQAFAKNHLPGLKSLGVAVIVNFFGNTVEEYAKMAEGLEGLDGIDGVELNISCPNVKCGGISFGKEPSTAAQVTDAVRKATSRTLIVKLSPASDVVEVARAVEGAGADAVSCINTMPAMAIDVKTGRPRLANVTGGLSGPAIRPIAVKMVYDVSRAVKIPVIGIGGIMSAEDAVEFAMAGATAVQIGTATYTNPAASEDILDGIEEFCVKNRVSEFKTLTGSVRIGD